MVLPAGTTLPPLPYAIAILAAVATVGGLLYRERPAVSEGGVLAFAPWMVFGAALHALYQLPVETGPIAPLLGTPAVYFTTFALAGGTWLAATRSSTRSARLLGMIGSVLALAPLAWVFASAGAFNPGWSILSIVLALVLGVVAWSAIRAVEPSVLGPAPTLSWLVLFAHALDGVSTAIGYDVFAGFHERTPLSRIILEFSASLPTAEVMGVGWLFVLVKLAVASAVVWLFSDYVRDRPGEGYLLLGFVAAVGLGPGVQNVLLYAVR